jgi:hypothetical protein
VRTIRWVGLAGAVVYLAGMFIISAIPGGGEPDGRDFEKFYVEDENTVLGIVGVLVLTVGCLGILWFLHELRQRVGSSLGGLGFTSAALGLALVAAGAGIIAGPSAVQEFGNGAYVGDNVAHALAQSGYGVMLAAGALFLGLGVGVLSYAARQTATLVSWVAIAGIVVAVLQLVAVFWIPSLLVPVWVGVAAVTSFRLVAKPTEPAVAVTA